MTEPGAAAHPSAATALRLALGVVYFWFGVLKFFPDLSTAEMLAEQTILRLGLGLSPDTALFALALFECTIGVLFLTGVAPRLVLALFVLHMLGTLLPLVLLPELVFRLAPFAPSFQGQYLLKNLVFLAAGWALYLDLQEPSA